MSHAIDAEWDRLGQPAEFTFVDYGAGPGTLARAVFAARPRCREHLRYIAVERSDLQHQFHPDGVESVAALTAEHIGSGLTGMVFANELLDNLAFTPVRWDGETALFGVVDIDDDAEGSLVTRFVPDPQLDSALLITGQSVVDQTMAGEWANWISTDVIAEGRMVVVDYSRQSTCDVEVRTFSEHGPAGDPLTELGNKDITVDVDLEVLQRRVGRAASITPQHVWLRQHGIDELVEQGRIIWERGAAVGGLEALRGKSRLREADALTDPIGLGGFVVSEWAL